jgi:hypothetical protein
MIYYLFIEIIFLAIGGISQRRYLKLGQEKQKRKTKNEKEKKQREKNK